MTPVVQLATGIGAHNHDATVLYWPTREQIHGAAAKVGRCTDPGCPLSCAATDKLQLIICVLWQNGRVSLLRHNRVERIVGAFVPVVNSVLTPPPTKEDDAQ
jgi:hypothetical protein